MPETTVRPPAAGSAPVPALPGTPRPLPRPARAVVLLLLGWLFIGPRVELPVAPGLRLEDLVFALIAAICTRAVLLRRAHPVSWPPAPTLAVLAVVGSGLVAAAVGTAAGTLPLVTSLLYAVRPLEYWIVFPAVRLLLAGDERSTTRRLDLLLAVTTVLQAAFAAAQYFLSLDIGFSHAAYTRAAGLTVGPYELGAIGAVLTVYWLSRRRFLLAAVAALALVLSLSRISLLGAAVGVVLLAGSAVAARRRAPRERRAPLLDRLLAAGPRGGVRVAAIAAVAAVLLGGALGYAASPAGGDAVQRAAAPLVERFSTTSVLGSWTASAALAERVPTPRTAAKYQDAAYARLSQYVQAGDTGAEGAEPSNLVRFFRWHLILDSVDEPREVVLGLGPSFVGPSVDGSYLRFFADAGLLGLGAWVALIVTWLRRTPVWMVSVTATMLVGAVFIDIVYAERPMAVYWTLLALAWNRIGAGVPGGRHRGRAVLLGGGGRTPFARPLTGDIT